MTTRRPDSRQTLADQIGKWRQLAASQKRLVLFAGLVALPATWAALRLFGLGRIQHWLAAPSKKAACEASHEEVEEVARFVDLAAKHTFVPTTCLSRSLTLLWMLKTRGVAAKLRIGARVLEGRQLEAHAWTEYRGRTVNDPDRISERFEAFAEALPARTFLR
jgi:hypothetical protein